MPRFNPWQQVQGHQSTGPQDLPTAWATGNGFCAAYGAPFANAAAGPWLAVLPLGVRSAAPFQDGFLVPGVLPEPGVLGIAWG